LDCIDDILSSFWSLCGVYRVGEIVAQVECYFLMDLLSWLVVLFDFNAFDTMLDMPNTND
jgi:hypothetical protein